MINLSHFRYATTTVGFGTAGTSAASTAKDNSSKVSSALATSVSGASSSSPFESASQDQISGASTLAANAAIARVNAQKKKQSTALLKQIDSVQAAMDQAKAEAALKQKYYVYTLPAVIVDTTDTTGTTTDTTA
ncbi:MAG: hypothetical protein PSV22_26240 [Pseudolabrys sp.]|nr:hypothetical protein [Pseudolabrys sp.]